MGKTLAGGWIYGLQSCCIPFYEAKPRKFFEFVRSVTGRMDGQNETANRKEIINSVYKLKRTNTKIKADSVKNTMNLFMANKQLGFGVNLEELKRMTPQEAYLFGQQVAEALRQLEIERLAR